MKIKISLLLVMLSCSVLSNPIETAQNVFNEFKQVQELIKQFEEIEKQINKQKEILDNLSGINFHSMSTKELEILLLFPQGGDEILEPTASGEYTENYTEIKEELNFVDPEVKYNIVGYSNHPRLSPRAVADKNLQQSAIAGSAYHKTWMDSVSERVEIVTDYLDKLSTSDTMKSSVDINAQMTAQAVLNQIEINKTMSMLLQLEAAKSEQKLTLERDNLIFFRPEIIE